MPGYHDPVQHRLRTFSADAIQEYFSQLNPIAKRITFDINTTKASYGKLWDTLSYHEQNDIINETLIKPEVSLRYFDNFLTPTPTNSSDQSYQSSTDSLTAIVFKDVNARRGSGTGQEDRGKKNNTALKPYGAKYESHDIKSFYSYDGRNLNTFGMQKVGLKVIQDEALGCFRDEHSLPFCYRTKSQINLFVLTPNPEPMAARNATALSKNVSAYPKTAAITFEIYTAEKDDSKKALDNYHRLQHQLKINLQEKKSQDLQSTSAYSTSLKPSSVITSLKNVKSPDVSFKHESKDKGLTVSKSTKSSMLQNYINSTQLNVSPKMGVNYAVFSDAYNIEEESSNLLQHCGQIDLAIGSCSSAATSDDDEKTLEEDVHLLENESTLRKGFDFLNNW